MTTPPPSSDALVAALIEEARSAEVAGRRQVARQRYESALYLLRDRSQAHYASLVLRRVGRTHLDDGDLPAGLDCLEAALAIAQANEDVSEIAHTVNVMAISHWQRGQLEEAERLYHEAGQMARKAGDQVLVAMVEQNLGVVASMHGDYEKALRHYSASLEIYRDLQLEYDLARALNNVGMAYTWLARYQDAAGAFEEAHTIAERRGDTWTRIMVEVNRTGLLITLKDFASARRSCDRVLLEAKALDDMRLLAETHKHAGVIARETQRLQEAERFLQSAFDEAMSRGDLLLAAETAREQAELHLARGRNRATLQALSTSHRLFSKLRAQRDLADVRSRLRTLEHRFHDLVRQWAQSIESKDQNTLGHCERVADYACAIASDLGFDEITLFWFRVGALLHDVGKIVVPSDILNKPGPLSPEERAIMERHPTAGVELLRDVEFPWDPLPMVRGHHERWDGHGYPDRLAGEDIPLAARILCVADVYDALTSQRPYRAAYQARDAMQLMQGDSGRQFDPVILERFFRIVARENLTERRRVPEALFATRPSSEVAKPLMS